MLCGRVDHGSALDDDGESVVQRVCVRGRGGLAAVRQLGDRGRVPREAGDDHGAGEAGGRAADDDARHGRDEQRAGARLAEHVESGPEHAQPLKTWNLNLNLNVICA